MAFNFGVGRKVETKKTTKGKFGFGVKKIEPVAPVAPVVPVNPLLNIKPNTPLLGKGIQPTTTILPSIKNAVNKGNVPQFNATPMEAPKPVTLGQATKNIGTGIANMFVGSSKKFGSTIGTAVSTVDPETTRIREEETLQATRNQIDNYLKLAKETTDKTKKDRYLKAIQNLSGDNDIFNTPEYQKTAKQIFGEALGTGLEVTGFSTIAGKGSKALLASKELAQQGVKQTGKQILKQAGKEALTVGAPLGVGYGVAQAMQDNKSGEDIVKEGLKGGALGGALQFGLGAGLRGLGSLAKPKTVNAITPNKPALPKKPQEAITATLPAKTTKVSTKVKPVATEPVEDFGTFLGKESEKGVEQVKKQVAKEIEQIIPDKKAQKLESRVYARMRENIPTELQGDANYSTKGLKAQAKSSIEVINKNPERAYKIAMGMETPKGNQTSASVNIALAEKARLDGNKQLYADLVKNRSLAQTKRGQEIVAERLLTDNSVDSYVKQAIKNRLEAKSTNMFTPDVLKSLGKKSKVSVVTSNITEQAKNVVTKVKDFDISEAQKFIDSITCK